MGGPSASSVAARTRSRAEKWAVKVWDEEQERPARLASALPLPCLASALPPTRGCLSPSTTDDGLQVSIEIVYVWLMLTCDSSSTNARFIESLDSKYKPSVDRAQESRKDASDDEDEDALFAELEAELENADSAALRDRGIKEVQAKLRRFSSLRPLNRSIDMV